MNSEDDISGMNDMMDEENFDAVNALNVRDRATTINKKINNKLVK